jgi:hypothetical protein
MAANMHLKTSAKANEEDEDGPHDEKHPREKGATERPSPVGIDG